MYEPDGDVAPVAMQQHVYVAVQRVAPVTPTVTEQDPNVSLALWGWQPDSSDPDYWEWAGQWNTGLGPTPPDILESLPAGLDPVQCRERRVCVRYWTESGDGAPQRGLLMAEFRVWVRGGPGEDPVRLKGGDRVVALAADVVRALQGG